MSTKSTKKKRRNAAAMIGVAASLSLSPLLIPEIGTHVFKASFNPLEFTSGTFQDCPPEGDGNGDPTLSMLKNRDKAPATAFKKMSVAAIVEEDLPETSGWEIVRKKSKRADWSDENKAAVDRLEKKGVTVQGYFLYAIAEKGEMCNCGSLDFVDNHTWLVDNEPDATNVTDLKNMRTEAIVAEISPRLHGANGDLHPNYSASIIRKIAAAHKQVKVSGWLTWDQDHAEQLGKTRATLWEVHPILDIKVELTPGKWTPLDNVDTLTAFESKPEPS
jgi:hypothetical protein